MSLFSIFLSNILTLAKFITTQWKPNIKNIRLKLLVYLIGIHSTSKKKKKKGKSLKKEEKQPHWQHHSTELIGDKRIEKKKWKKKNKLLFISNLICSTSWAVLNILLSPSYTSMKGRQPVLLVWEMKVLYQYRIIYFGEGQGRI